MSVALAAPADLRRPVLRWVHLTVAALPMVATLPGRTLGLGLVTKPLMADLRLGEVDYASINLWATLIGAAFCLPCGWLIDRLSVRIVLTATLLGLGGMVVAMSRVQADWVVSVGGPYPFHVAAALFAAVLLTAGERRGRGAMRAAGAAARRRGRLRRLHAAPLRAEPLRSLAYEEFHRWLRAKYAEYGKTDVVFE